MRLIRVDIKNYRSIKDLQITFDPKCRILVGINESGKTNILDALNLLDSEVKTEKRDLREAGRDEPPIANAYVRFVFDFTADEIANRVEQIKASLLASDYDVPLIEIDGSEYNLQEYCESRQGLYNVDLVKGQKNFTVFKLNKAKVLDGWKKVSPDCPDDFVVHLSKSKEVPLNEYSMVNSSQFPDIPASHLVDMNVDDLDDPLADMVKEHVETSLLNVLFWDYDEKKLLPPRINLDAFCTTPDSCLPLKRMFQLYGTTDIKLAVTEAKAGSANTLSNMLERVAEKTSKHFHNTWREYDGIQFSLTLDGADLVAGIKDQSNRYELQQRSDGFKRFVTFLLLVSAEAATDSLKDTVLLIDEPEIGLHPTGARYLMNELIKISNNNYVVFSTHSIFMVDGNIIKRHLIVKKENEITSVADPRRRGNLQISRILHFFQFEAEKLNLRRLARQETV
jgi:predicted ATP-dependent endonuclease of OLD family